MRGFEKLSPDWLTNFSIFLRCENVPWLARKMRYFSYLVITGNWIWVIEFGTASIFEMERDVFMDNESSFLCVTNDPLTSVISSPCHFSYTEWMNVFLTTWENKPTGIHEQLKKSMSSNGISKSLQSYHHISVILHCCLNSISIMKTNSMKFNL